MGGERTVGIWLDHEKADQLQLLLTVPAMVSMFREFVRLNRHILTILSEYPTFQQLLLELR